MNLAIVGSRDFTNYKVLEKSVFFVLNALNLEIKDIEHICSGGARGVDTLAEMFAEKYDIKTNIFKANWNLLGKSAGYLRNIDIIKNSDIVIAIHKNRSKGTQHSINLAKKLNKKVFVLSI